MKKQISKFTIQDMLPIGMTLVILGIALAYGLEVMGETRDDIGETDCAARSDGFTSYSSTTDQCTNSSGDAVSVNGNAFNASGDAIDGVAKLPEKLPTIVTVIVAAVIIGILVTYLAGRFM